MIHSLSLHNVGPAPELSCTFSPRFNLLTGDNGLGKSFLLDVVWWALTRKWPHDVNPHTTSGFVARPLDNKSPATIAFEVDGKAQKRKSYETTYTPRAESWQGKRGRPLNPGLVVYAHSDGGFSVWDPARNYWNPADETDAEPRLPGYVLTPYEVWHGLDVSLGGKALNPCKGLLADWTRWIGEKGENARWMEKSLEFLAPKDEPIRVGPLLQVSPQDAWETPSLQTSHSPSVPIIHASAGVRRALGLAYILIWSWQAHRRAAESLGEAPTTQITMLFDEVESHLHPRWQRTILPSLHALIEALHPSAGVQLVAATHSPLVLASMEPFFDPKKDGWLDLDLRDGRVVLEARDFLPHGDASRWLTSDAFGLKSSRSSLGESAVEEARALMRQESPSELEIVRVHQALLDANLSDVDPFWVRWSYFAGRHTRKTSHPT